MKIGKAKFTYKGFTIQAYDAGYLDWGLRIEQDGKVLFDNPHYLSNQEYGCTHNDECDDAPLPWSEDKWKKVLLNEADDFLEMLDDNDDS